MDATETKTGPRTEQEEAARRANQKYMYSALIFGLAAACLAIWWFQNKRTPAGEVEASAEHGLLGGESALNHGGVQSVLLNQDAYEAANDVPRQPPAPPKSDFPPNETEESMMQLALALYKAGVRVYGSSRCGWTVRQRELFGPRTSKARLVFESCYVECVTQGMCPDIEGYPTWAHGAKQFPGFRNPEALRAILAEVSLDVNQPMLGTAPAPAPEEADDAPPEAPPEPARVVRVEIKELPAEDPPSEPAAAGETEEKKEMARGVSEHLPLNVPDMPGTAPMSLEAMGRDHHTYQLLQGNVPRASSEDPRPVAAIASQLAATLSHVKAQQARVPGSSSFSQGQQPHSVSISSASSDPFANKDISPRRPERNRNRFSIF